MQFLFSMTHIRSRHGLIAAGVIASIVLFFGVVVFAAPTGVSIATEGPVDDDPVELVQTEAVASAQGPTPPTTLPVAGASSRDASEADVEPAPEVPLGDVYEVSSVDGWNSAVAAVQPGDTILLTATITTNLIYRGSRSDRQNATDGTAELPITITAADGVWIDPGDLNNRKPALDIDSTAHVHAVGLRVRNSQFGIRVLESFGSPEAPLLIADNVVESIGHAGIHVGGDLNDHAPSQHVRVEGNTVSRTGLTAPEFGEGVYLGYGSREWADRSSDLAVVNNEIFLTGAEAVDIKPGTRNVLVEGNLIHDLSPLRGGAISAHYVGTAPNPDPGTPGNVVIRDNRIWNVNLDGRAGSNDWAIWVGHGGVTIENNAIWGLRGDPGRTRAVRIRAIYDFGPHAIRIVDNVFWTATGWLAEGSPWAGDLVTASGNEGPAGAAGVDVPLDPHPSAPPIGSGGEADQGSGPGSALGFDTDGDDGDLPGWIDYEPGF